MHWTNFLCSILSFDRCSSYHNGGSIHPNTAFDGLFGFGRGALSVISQFSAKGLTPKVFSHCLRGGPIGGGTLVFGEIMEPNIVYTPLIPSRLVHLLDNSFNSGQHKLILIAKPNLKLHCRSYYGLYLESVAVNGSAVFAPRLNKEIAVDSGTTLTYLAEDSYNFLIDSVSPCLFHPTTVTTPSLGLFYFPCIVQFRWCK